MFSLLKLVTAAALVGTVSAQSGFIGCFNFPESTGGTLTPISPNPGTSADCAAACLSSNPSTTYVYWRTADCMCGTGSGPSAMVVAQHTSQVCTYDTDYRVYNVKTTFDFGLCTDMPAYVPADFDTPENAVAAPSLCFSQCASYQYAVLSPRSGRTWSCKCANLPVTGPSDALCETTEYYIFSHSLLEASAGLARRARQTALAVDKSRCRWGFTACAIDGTSSYECLDTQSEIYSCGGCLYGSEDTTKQGTDCTTLPGIRRNGVTCQVGGCKVWGCRPGWELVNGTCVQE